MLLGANGSGKSTLLKLLDGIIGPTAGTMRALGRDIAAVAAGEDAFRFHREVGLVFQDPDIQLFSATVLDDVAFGPLQLGLPPEEVARCCTQALAAMEIEGLAHRAPFELSGGEKKRAAIASVLSLEPSVVLLDEPTASLDPRTKWVLVNLIRGLAAEGRTLVTATHELDIVPIIADRVVVLGEERRVLADGTAGCCAQRPRPADPRQPDPRAPPRARPHPSRARARDGGRAPSSGAAGSRAGGRLTRWASTDSSAWRRASPAGCVAQRSASTVAPTMTDRPSDRAPTGRVRLILTDPQAEPAPTRGGGPLPRRGRRGTGG